MTDPRVDKLAQVLVRYCLGLKPGNEFRISGPALAEDLIRSVYREALLAGAHPIVRIGISGLGPIRYTIASDAQLQYVPETTRLEVEKLSAALTIWGDWNTKEMTNIDSRKIALAMAANRALNERFMERAAHGELHWCGTLFPNHANAQDAEMSLAEYEDFVFGAMLLDKPDPIAEWQRISREQDRLVQHLNQAQTVRIKGKDTDLEFRCADRKWINCDGKENFPDGEIFTGPVEDSVQGKIRFTFPATYIGKEVEDIQLRFEKGKVVEAHAGKGEELLQAMLNTDPGARYVGEIAIGTNYGITRFTKNTLFDEKIGGTVHLALGASLPESGGVNKSGIHWDIVCDLRSGGEILADAKPIHKDGKFLI